MKRVSGIVLAKETNLGVPNLVVAVFDSQLAIEDIWREDSAVPLIRRIGRRISSVLTDADGRFLLSSEDLEFTGNEPRPNLVLMVLAPEDIQDAERPFPLPMEARVLYVSTMPRVDAGAEEAYVIRLLQAQLDRFQIVTGPRGRDTHTAIRELSDGVLTALDIRNGVRERLAERRAAEQKALDRARRSAQKKLARFNALPPHLKSSKGREDALLIVDRTKLAADLPRLQRKAIKEGLARIRKAPTPKIRLRLTNEDVADLGLKVRDGKVEGRVKAELLNKKIRALVNVLDLVRIHRSQPSPEELERRYLSQDREGDDEPRDRPSRSAGARARDGAEPPDGEAIQ